MRLERVFTHRLLRLLRMVLPVFVLLLIAVPAWNYLARRVQKLDTAAPSARKLPSGVSVHTDGFSYSATEGGKTKYTVHAKQQVGFKGDKYMLQDVDVVVFGATETEPNRNIRGKICTIEQETNDFECDGNVEIQLDERTIVRTEQAIYSHRDQAVTTPGHAILQQEGTTGQADKLEYALSSGLMKLTGNVDIQTAEHTQLQASAALFQRKENWTTMDGGVLIKSANAWVRGSTGRAELEPDTYKPRIVTVEGNVTGESHPPSQGDAWKFRASWLQAELSHAGIAEKVKTRGNVDIEKLVETSRQSVQGDEVDISFKDDRIESLQARGAAIMEFGSDQTLTSSQIWTNGTGSIQTTDKSVLNFGDSTIEGRAFSIENGQDFLSFKTDRPATLRKASGQESSSDQTTARFDNRTNMLVELVQTGSFKFHDAERQGQARDARFDEEGTVITLQGSAVVNDPQMRLEAPEIRLNQNNNTFLATKNVTTFMKNTEQPVLVKAARAEGGAESVLYNGDVQLWRGDTYLKADKLEAVGQANQGGKLHAEALPNRKVQSNLQNVRASSDTLDYDETAGVIHYVGHVRGQRQDMVIDTPDMTVNFRDKSVTEILASGGVTVTRADQVGQGDRAVYKAETDIVTLTGKNAQVRDRENGLIEGPLLTMRNKEKRMSAEAGVDNGGRTTTKHPVKNDKK